MFKLVEARFEEPQVESEVRRSGMGIVDLQLVDDALARDRALTDPEGVKKIIDGIPRYGQRYLRERMSVEEFSSTFDQLTRVLIELAEGRDFLLFLRHPPDDFDRSEYDEFYSISAYCDNGLLNGSLDIVRLACDELRDITEIWGEYDGVRGIAVDPSTPTASILAHCSLASPGPTTVQRFDQRRVGYSSLISVLPHVGFFFEEVGNSTRLRIASAHLDRTQLSESVQRIVRDLTLGDSQESG